MSTKKTFLVSGNTVRVRDAESVKAFDALPPKTYTVKFDERAGEFYLEEIDSFSLPTKIYGKNTNYAERILRTFESRPGQTGVLLNGIKGAGKTLLAKQTAVLAAERGIPTIVINRDWHGDEFNSFIQSINTPSIVMFDEFEKIYDYTTQRKVLTLFDGVFNSRKLFMVTTNEERDISEFMQNRPGRMYYNFTFDTLGQDFIEEFLDDRLKDKSYKDEILKYTKVFSFFNFDMLSACVEEMNRYGESLAEVLEVLNIKPENKRTDTHRVDLVVLGRRFMLDRSYYGFQPNSFNYNVWIDNDLPDTVKRDDEVCAVLGYKSKDSAPSSQSGGNAVSTKALQKYKPVDEFNLSSILSGPQDEDSITFDPSLIKEFDQVENKFVYSIDRNGAEVQLHVTRNDPITEWKYHSQAL